MTIQYEEFEKVDMRIGTIIEVNEFPEARKPAYQVKIDFGPSIGIKKSSAQITDHYQDREKLIGKQVIAVINFPPKQIGPFRSEVLLLGLSDDQGQIVLVAPDKQVPNGGKLH